MTRRNHFIITRPALAAYVKQRVTVTATLRPGTPVVLEATVGEYGRPGRRDYALKDVTIEGIAR